MTGALGEAISLAQDATGAGYQVVIAVGGDGTVNEVVNGLIRNGLSLHERPVLGIIPMGSGCDLARTLKLPKNPFQALAAIENGAAKLADAGRATYMDLDGRMTSRLFINIADLGGGGVVVQRASRAPRIFGRRPNYLYGIVTAALTYGARDMEISVDDGPFTPVSARNVIIANGRFFGRGFHAAPLAEINDGYLDVIQIGNFGLLEGMRAIPKLYRGKHLGLEKVSYGRARRVEARSKHEVLLEMDGDLVGRLPATFEVLPGAIRIIDGVSA